MADSTIKTDPSGARPRPTNPDAPPNVDPLDPLAPAGAPRRPVDAPPLVDNRSSVETRGSNVGVIAAGVIVVLAIIAYFLFAPGSDNVPAVVNEPTATETQPATGTAPAAPAAETPAAPATDTAPAPATDAAPTTPAPDATAPAVPAPESSTPAAPAPAQPAPAQ